MKINNDIEAFNPNSWNKGIIGIPLVIYTIFGGAASIIWFVSTFSIYPILMALSIPLLFLLVFALNNGNASERLGSESRNMAGRYDVGSNWQLITSTKEKAYRAYKALPKSVRSSAGLNFKIDDFVNMDIHDAETIKKGLDGLLYDYNRQQSVLARTDVTSALQAISIARESLNESTKKIEAL